ncbi:MAG: signal recognition particle protein [Planctomycetota bacterium]|nr:signal recognition particle protein [Planctomycetota bacterium]MDI6787662.1 signal recognition particle protein [Planctomycetota bacterium]
MFESITEKLQAVFKKLSGTARLTEKNIQDGLREVRLALLEADVNYKIVKDFIDAVTKKAVGKEIIESISPAQQIIKTVNDELVKLMGPVEQGLKFASVPPTRFILAGLQGSGKTTTCAKLARFISKTGHQPLLVAADIRRPAAIEQLQTLGRQLNIPVYSENPDVYRGAVRICENSIKYAREHNLDCVIMDTAGRLHIDQEMMEELKQIAKRINPDYIFLVADAMTGQDAVNSAKVFDSYLPLNGIILTKLDGDTRGGAALSIKAVTGKPIRFVGIGEKIDNLEEFYPERMAGRILGMGDIVSLVEKAQQTIDKEKAEKLEEKLRKNKLDLQDFLDQLQQIKKMGNLKELLSMIPGVSGSLKNLDIDDKHLKKVEAIVQSMTQDERENPEIIDHRRRNRIARGSGTAVGDVNQLLKQFQEMQKMMKNIGKMPRMGKLMGNLFGR